MFDIDDFLVRCQEARAEAEPRRAVREVLVRALAAPEQVGDALAPSEAGFTLLHHADDLTVMHVVWAPKMTLGAHDHRMWAAIALYSGGEDNSFYRRAEPGLVESGGRTLRPSDVCLLGAETIHAVANPTTEYAGAIHVYGGDFFAATRSEWIGDPLREQPYDVNRVLAAFEAANLAAEASEN